ncbi:MAG: transglutaminase family protein, partial [Acidimicrobiia bacterium]|nr:transglutaminase family protein [Acidimicrobiia bacterium]
MEIAIRYLTTFTYDTHVSESHNALRACPASTGTQQLVRYSVTVDPEARISSHHDYWGTRVDSFGVVGNHSRLTVVADAVVETTKPATPGDGGP